jgi:hypothetical protein
VINVSQIITLDKTYLTDFISMLPKYVISQVGVAIGREKGARVAGWRVFWVGVSLVYYIFN